MLRFLSRVVFVHYLNSEYLGVNGLFSNILLTVLQILILVLTQNFILYTVVQMVITFLNNAVISKVADHMYPFLKERCRTTLKPSIFAQLLSSITASVGNLGVAEGNKKKRDIFHVAFFVDL